MDREKWLKALTTGAVAAAAILGFTAQPIVKAADPFWMFTGSQLFALGILYYLRAITFDDSRRRGLIVAIAFLGAGMGIWSFVAIQASSDIDKLEARCKRIQHIMLYEQRVRTDVPAVFTALGCSQQP